MGKLETSGKTEGNITSFHDFPLSYRAFYRTHSSSLADWSKNYSKKDAVTQKLFISALAFWQHSVSKYFKICISQQEIQQATDTIWVWNADPPHHGSFVSLPARLLISFTATMKSKVKSGLLPQLPKLPREQCTLMAAEICWQSSLYHSRIEGCACWNLNLFRFPAIFSEGKKAQNKMGSAAQKNEY